MSVGVLPREELKALALGAGFDLVGFAPAEPIDAAVLGEWLAAGYHADLDWMAERVAERLDVRVLFPGAKTVVALACNYWQPTAAAPGSRAAEAQRSPTEGAGEIAKYARGRDYHHTLRDRLRTLRRSVRARWPDVRDYGSVDSNPVMEKVWAVRAGVGRLGKNACLITPEYGSWVVLAVMILDAEVEGVHDAVVPKDPCGRCRACVDACPTEAIVANGVVDARRCLSYQTIENEAAVPAAIRPRMAGVVFGCDICQDVCPHNRHPVAAPQRFAVRPVGSLSARALAALTPTEWDTLAPGTPLVRAGYHLVRRNAAYALGAARDLDARTLLETLTGDGEALVAEAARWALEQLASQ